MRIRQGSWASMLPTQTATTHATLKASMCPYCESCIKCAKHTQNIQKRPRNSNLSPKRYLIMNKIRDDDRIIQIATERGYSCGDKRHAILLTAHSTFTQQTQYTDNMATLNERQFFLLPPRHHTKSWVSQGAPSKQEISGVLSSLRVCSGTPPPFSGISPVHDISKNMLQQSYYSR